MDNVMYLNLNARMCSDCGTPATCQYDWGTGVRYGCAAHDPLRFPYGAIMARLPSYYCSLPPRFPVLATTGHLGIDFTGITS